jgi:hypothetical protein
MKNAIISFLKTKWLYILLFITLFFIGFKLFYSTKTNDQLNTQVIEKQYENKLLNDYLIIEKHKSDSIKKQVDSLYQYWKSHPISQIINIHTYDKERVEILNANNDKQFVIFAKWLSKTNSNR